MKKRVLLMASLAATLLSFHIGLGETIRRTQPFMRQKLTYAQGILEGITLEKFDLVLTNAAPLRDMSQTNAFLLLRNPDYLKRITAFQATVDGLTIAAKNKDLDGATKAYVRMTEGCVDCHKLFRREQFARRLGAESAK